MRSIQPLLQASQAVDHEPGFQRVPLNREPLLTVHDERGLSLHLGVRVRELRLRRLPRHTLDPLPTEDVLLRELRGLATEETGGHESQRIAAAPARRESVRRKQFSARVAARSERSLPLVPPCLVARQLRWEMRLLLDACLQGSNKTSRYSVEKRLDRRDDVGNRSRSVSYRVSLSTCAGEQAFKARFTLDKPRKRRRPIRHARFDLPEHSRLHRSRLCESKKFVNPGDNTVSVNDEPVAAMMFDDLVCMDERLGPVRRDTGVHRHFAGVTYAAGNIVKSN
jgi:hypothetical protein